MRRAALEGLVLGLLLALVLRWPVSLFPAAIPHDPNTALHMVAAADLAAHGDPFHLYSLDWPDGVPVRLIGWPLLLVALPLQPLLGPMMAFNLALVLLLGLQGAGIAAIGKALGWERPRRLLVLVGALAAPQMLLFLGNGQHENVVPLAHLAVAWGVLRGGRAGWMVAGAALLLAAFSTPYQGLVAGVLALSAGLVAGRRSFAGVLLLGALLALPVGLYFGSQAASGDPGADLTRTRPAAAVQEAAARIPGLVLPRQEAQIQAGDLESPPERLARVAQPPAWSTPDRRWPQQTPVEASYLGLLLLIPGLVGLYRGRREPLLQALALGGGICLVLSLGSRLGPLPLPWALFGRLPGLDQMGATVRFLTGVELALAVGLGRLLPGRAAALAGALLVLESLLVAPVAWPVGASSPRVRELQAALPSGPLLVWPGTPILSSHQHAVLRLSLDRPLASFNGPPAIEVPGQAGLRPKVPERNSRGETPAQWKQRLVERGAQGLLEMTPLPQAHRQPLVEDPGQVLGELRVYRLE